VVEGHAHVLRVPAHVDHLAPGGGEQLRGQHGELQKIF
jgi:hypothetical protein